MAHNPNHAEWEVWVDISRKLLYTRYVHIPSQIIYLDPIVDVGSNSIYNAMKEYNESPQDLLRRKGYSQRAARILLPRGA